MAVLLVLSATSVIGFAYTKSLKKLTKTTIFAILSMQYSVGHKVEGEL